MAKYICKNNPAHTFTEPTADFWCPLCEKNTGMLELLDEETTPIEDDGKIDALEEEIELLKKENARLNEIRKEDEIKENYIDEKLSIQKANNKSIIIDKKFRIAITSLFLLLFLVSHLVENLQLILKTGEEGKRAFNEYAYFMAHNPAMKILTYLTYISIIFHAVDSIMLAFQNNKVIPVPNACNNPPTNSSISSKNIALLGIIILVFICTHMANFWWKAKIANDKFPLHIKELTIEDNNPITGQVEKVNIKLYLTTSGEYVPVDQLEVKNKTDLYTKDVDLKMAEGYKDMHSLVFAFFGHNKSKEGFPTNDLALAAVIFYVLCMIVLGIYLWFGLSFIFSSYNLNKSLFVNSLFYGFVVLTPVMFAIIPIYIYITK